MKNLNSFIVSFLLISANVNVINNGQLTGNLYLSEEINCTTGNFYQATKVNQGSMPVIITKAKSKVENAPAAFIMSGDGGWYSFEQTIANKLADMGIGTIGLNTKKYFWNRRTPEETSADVNENLERYGKEWNAKDFILIGYSLGAELIPFVFNRLPDNMKSRISMLVLLSPTTTTDFQVHIADMIGIGNKKNIYKVTDEIMKIKDTPVLLIFGAEEESQLPALLKEPPVMIDTIPGDHHYENNTSLIVKTMQNHKAF